MPFSAEKPPRIVVFDLDDTLIAGDSTQMWLTYLYDEGVVTDPRYREVNDRMIADYAKGTLDIFEYERNVMPAVSHLAPEEVDALVRRFAETKIRPLVYREGIERIDRAKALGIPVQIISATCTFIVRPIAEILGVENVIGVDMKTDAEGRLTGKIDGVPSFREGKVVRMKAVLERLGIDPEDMLFFTDSRNDLPLARFAGAAEVVSPDPVLRKEAEEKSWPIHAWHKVTNPETLDR